MRKKAEWRAKQIAAVRKDIMENEQQRARLQHVLDHLLWVDEAEKLIAEVAEVERVRCMIFGNEEQK